MLIHKQKRGGIGWHRLCGGKYDSPKDAVWLWEWVTCKKCLALRIFSRQEEKIMLLELEIETLRKEIKTRE